MPFQKSSQSQESILVGAMQSKTSSGSTVASGGSSNECSFRSVASDPMLDLQKTPLLAGFDPFFPDDHSEPTTPQLMKKRATKPPVPESPVFSTPDERNDGARDSVRLEQLSKELRAIATQLEQDSPRKCARIPPSPETKNQKNSPKGGSIFSPLAKKLSHRRTGSLDANKRLWREVQEQQQANLARPPHVHTRSATASAAIGNTYSQMSTPSRDSVVLQEVWMKQGSQVTVDVSSTTVTDSNNGIEALYIPSLAKPRPTSFLTGDDVVRTSEYDATKWQLEIPDKKNFVVASKVLHFLDTYHSKECLLDLHSLVGYSRFQLSEFASGSKMCPVTGIADCHRPIVESLLDCGDDIVEVRGYWHTASSDLDSRREVLILERQQQFLVVMRGTATEQQHGRSQRQAETVSLKDGKNVTVFADPFRALQEIETELFRRLDQLTEAIPFCDVVFSGHSFGASMAVLGAYLYAYTRTDQRVAAVVAGCPKVGLQDFRWSVHATPNLKVMRLECSNYPVRGGAPSPKASHVGHTIRLSKQHDVKAYKFSTGPAEARGGARSLLFKKERDICAYVRALEECSAWVTDYYNEDGAGVRGKDNETRQVV